MDSLLQCALPSDALQECTAVNNSAFNTCTEVHVGHILARWSKAICLKWYKAEEGCSRRCIHTSSVHCTLSTVHLKCMCMCTSKLNAFSQIIWRLQPLHFFQPPSGWEKAILEQIISLQFPLLTPCHRAIHYQSERGKGGGSAGQICQLSKSLSEIDIR